MGRFSGSYSEIPKSRGPYGGIRGVLHMYRQWKRAEAEERNARTPHDRTKAHRLKRCSCG